MAHYKIPSLPPPPPSASLKEAFSPKDLNPSAANGGQADHLQSQQQQEGAGKPASSLGGDTSQSSNSPRTSNISRPSVRRFDMAAFRTQLQKLCHAHLAHTKWDAAKAKEWSSLVGNAAKQKMLEQEPKGYKYIVSVSLSQNAGQQGRGDAQTHWDPDSDSMTGLVWSNDSMIVTILACAVRTAY